MVMLSGKGKQCIVLLNALFVPMIALAGIEGNVTSN